MSETICGHCGAAWSGSMSMLPVHPSPKFSIGEIVAMPGFTDCFGKPHPRVELARVVERKLEISEYIAPYWRYKIAEDAEGWKWQEASERFFEKLGG